MVGNRWVPFENGFCPIDDQIKNATGDKTGTQRIPNHHNSQVYMNPQMANMIIEVSKAGVRDIYLIIIFLHSMRRESLDRPESVTHIYSWAVFEHPWPRKRYRQWT